MRTRTYLVEGVDASHADDGGTVVRMACLNDDAQGHQLEVIWELEQDARVLDEEAWQDIGKRGFDPPREFGAYVHALRWNCVTATDPKLFQSPFRAGIRIDAYQLEPLRKALLLPRVNLFIADDVGLGKTIEAGLIASELLLRRRVREVVVACPPTMLPQWRDELETRFGLTFEIYDRDYVRRVREQQGYGVNPWATFPRFLVSHKLLIDETHAGPLRAWLDNLRPGSLLILDEAHHAAPSAGGRYAIDSRITRAVRDLAPRFEHRLFLSATPHNGHSNSFSALLELLDPQRFTRGVKVRAGKDLGPVMVRRLKDDVREVAGGFPKRTIKQVDIEGLPADAPELLLSRLLNSYRDVRLARVAGAPKRKQAEAMLLISGLQQRLLSSVEAFARTLSVHRRTMEKVWAVEPAWTDSATPAAQLELVTGDIDADDDRAQLEEDDLQRLEEQALVATTVATAGDSKLANVAREKELLAEMERVANAARNAPDARVRHLLDWIRRNMCPAARVPGQPADGGSTNWTDLRVIIFTEYEDTRRYLVNVLQAAIAHTDQADNRVAVFHGPTPPDKREAIKRAFNLPPNEHPVRILVATDAAREGLNLQAHCWDLFHFDVPWNPSRLEQRNGRIDRKLQPNPEVTCHYFVYTQRPEDRVLQVLVRKTKRIREELGSLSQVLESRLAAMIRSGIAHSDADAIASALDAADLDASTRATTAEELDAARARQADLRQEVASLGRLLDQSRKWIGYDPEQLRDALTCSLNMDKAGTLQPVVTGEDRAPAWGFAALDARHGADPSWITTLDTLRAPPEDGRRSWEWRRNSPIRPVTFEAPKGIDDDTVQLHLSHRLVQRLLSRFVAQGFVYHDLSRACLAQADDNVARVVLLGRLSIYGVGATRLHEELLTVTARWSDDRKGPLLPYARDAEARTMEILEHALSPARRGPVPEPISKRMHASMSRDIAELKSHLESRGRESLDDARKRLEARGRIESDAIRDTLSDQRQRVAAELAKSRQAPLDFSQDEKRQFESNRRYWERWLANVDGDLTREPKRILDFYSVATHRVEPVGIAYLWPMRH